MKKFKLNAQEIVELVPPMGYCFATDKITVEGLKVGWMYREEPDDEQDSGWRFFSGTETQHYVNDPQNTMIYSVNNIANYDAAIIPYLKSPYGTSWEGLQIQIRLRRLKCKMISKQKNPETSLTDFRIPLYFC